MPDLTFEAANPALAKPLATAMGYRPPAQGSQPKELQIYNLLLLMEFLSSMHLSQQLVWVK